MRILFVDDEPHNVTFVADTLKSALDAQVDVVGSVSEAVHAVLEHTYDLVVADVFIPPGPDLLELLGPRSRLPEGQGHLGGLLLLQEIERMAEPPKVLVHTACNEYAMVEVLKEHGHNRVPKPAPVDVLLRAVLEALELPSPS